MTAPREKPPAYDDREIAARSIGRLALGFVVMIVVAGAIANVVTDYIAARQRGAYAPAAAILSARPVTPPTPRLQPSPPVDLATLRAEEERVLRGYAWIDRGNGVVSIPIDRAMELVVTRGLPARAASPPASTAAVPTNATLGDHKAGAP
ncbi:MAG TPA: hypothetical protein VGM56_22150 [Byssovorax sp.]